jgi:hypothetical protein
VSEFVDLVEGNQATETAQGRELVRVIQLSGITGNPEARIVNALEHPAVPPVGEPHPADPTLRVFSARAQADGASTAKVFVTYKRPNAIQKEPDDNGPVIMQVGSTTRTEDTNLDALGLNPLELSFTYPDDHPTKGGRTEKVSPLLQKQVPQSVLNLQRHESENPLQKSLVFVGKVNSETFFFGSPRKWLCTRIEGRSDNGGQSYDVTYTFLFNPERWDVRTVFIDPDTGFPPDGVRIGAGIETFEIYRQANFNDLNLFEVSS